jgi:3-oxoacyl-[acyl-carrier protein] reductase
VFVHTKYIETIVSRHLHRKELSDMPEYNVALITGASRGIGRTIAIGLAELGFHVALVARSEPQLERVAQEISDRAGSSSVSLFPIDIAETQAVNEVVSTICDVHQRIDVLVNNAGRYATGTLDIPEYEFDQVLQVNLKAPLTFIQAVVPIMQERRQGHIINIASGAGKVGFAKIGGYVASKFGLVGLSESCYRELAAWGIKVTTLCPSWVDTMMAKQAGSPLEGPEMIQPEDILQTIRWLLQLSPTACVKEVVIECRATIR